MELDQYGSSDKALLSLPLPTRFRANVSSCFLSAPSRP